MTEPQRLIVLGHTGLGKSLAVRNLARGYLRQHHGLETGLEHVDHGLHLRVSCLEDFIDDIHAFLDLTNETHARRQWSDALDSALSQLESGTNAAHQILSFHGSYYRKSRAFSRADLASVIARFEPTAVCVLVDDVYEVASAIRSRDAQDALRLREIATWRSIEGMIADFIARPLNIPSYTLAVKHPVSMAVDLLFSSNTKIYSAFPISRHREEAADRAQIEHFKSRLRGLGLVVFDPSTIDEMLLRSALHEADVNAESIAVRLESRWDVAAETLLLQGRESVWDNGELRFARGEVVEATQDISRQVESRDFRMIHDSDFVVAYRPNWGGRPSRGVTAELHLARGIGRRAFIYSPRDDESDDDSPFSDLGSVYQSEDALIAAIQAARNIP